MRLKEIFKNLLLEKEKKWNKCKNSAVERMKELGMYFTGQVALTRVKKDDKLQEWFNGMANEIDSLSMEDEHATVTGRKIQHCVQALEDVEQFDVIDTNLAIKAFLKETREELYQMVRACNIKTEVLNVLETVTDFSYAWELLPDYLKVLHDRVKSDPATVVLLRALFLKLASILDVPVLRTMQCGSPDALSVAEYYSQELVSFVRRVMEIIPRSVFKILTNIVNIKERHLKQLPTKVEIDETKAYAQLDERFELAKLTHQVSIFTEGILAMEKTLLGVIQVDPRAILEDGIRKELVRQISEANNAVLNFPQSEKDKNAALSTSNLFVKNMQALANRVEGYRLAIEYIQDYIDIAGLRMWQSEICRIMQYNTEQEANRFLQKKIYDSQSRFQSRAIPIPTFPKVDGSINFMGRTVGALLRMTDSSSTIYSPECGGWFLADGTEVCGLATIGLLRKSIGVAGLMGVDRLLGFRIVNELQQFLKFYSSTVRQYSVLLEQIRDGLFPEWKNPAEQRIYGAAKKKVEKLMLPLLIAMRRIGQAQLLRKMIMNELHFRSKLDANVLHHALDTFDSSLVNDIREHYRDPEKPIPAETNPMMEQAVILLDSNGLSDPLQKIYVTSDPLEGLPVLLLLFVTSYMDKLQYSTDFGTLVRSKSSFPLDGWPLSVGMASLLKQFHPSYARSVLAYLGQFVRSTITSSVAAATGSGKSEGAADIPKEVTNTIVFSRQVAESLKMSSAEMNEHCPQFITESLTLMSAD
jgi:WASH complex subunit strumpellin